MNAGAEAAAAAAAAAPGAAGSAATAPGPGFRLTGTGRCVHARGYVLTLAAAHGFAPVSVTRRAIRQNAGADVLGDLFVLTLAP